MCACNSMQIGDRVKIIYWTGTGNTAAMAVELSKGIMESGKECEILDVATVTPEDLDQEMIFALGCPSMGAEQLEESTMEPFMEALEGKIGGKKIVLFGSYGWGNQEWMRDWEDRITAAGATVMGGEGITCLYEPDNETLAALCEMGKKMGA